jgi:predicted dehydrogenase
MSDTTSETAPRTVPRIGLVGAGPWGQLFTGPMLAGSADCEFAGVWARRPEAAEELAAVHGVPAFTDLDALIDASDGLTFSLPPDVQADLAGRAARAGKAVLLDKPVGLDTAEAERLAAVIDEAGVPSQVILTNRYYDSMRAFLDAARTFDSYGGRASFFGNGCVPGTYFATPWRLEQGGLLDLGPHVLDGLDAALGRIVSISARGDARRIVLLECEHDNGRVSQAALSATSNQSGGLAVEVHGLDGRHGFDAGAFTPAQMQTEVATAQRRIVAEFAEAIRTRRPHELDIHRGVHLQRLIDAAAAQLAAS